MKRLLALILCVCLLISAQCAMAATGDKVLLRAGMNGVDSLSVAAIAYLNGTLYIMDRNTLYTYDGELNAYEYTVPARNEGAEINVLAMMTDGGDMRVLADEHIRSANSYDMAGLTLYTMKVTPDGAVEFTDPVELDYQQLMEYDEGHVYMRDIQSPFINDNNMVFITYADFGRTVMTYDLDAHYTEELYIENIDIVSPYKPGKALATTNHYTDSAIESRLCVLDLNSGELEEITTIISQNYQVPAGVICDARTDDLYYVLDGELYRIEGMRPETLTSVNAVQIDFYSNCMPALTDEGFYVVFDYSTVAIYSTDPNARAERRLVVQQDSSNAVEKAYYGFMETRGDVEIKLLDYWGGGDIVQAMLSRDDSVDISFLYASQSEYTSMYARGYLAELSGSEKLKAYVSDMYPAVREAIEKNGELYALPVEIESYENLGMNNSVMQTLGITEDDVPKTWSEFIEFVNAFPALAAGHTDITLFEVYETRYDIERRLFFSLWLNYVQYIQSMPEAEMTFDTPIFRELLGGLKQIDYEALGVPDDYDEDDDGYESGEYLINMYSDISADTGNRYVTPMPLSFIEGEDPIIHAELMLLIVNPYSKDRQLAIEFLEAVVDNISVTTLTRLNMHRDEPVLNVNYEATIESRLARIEALKTSMEQADEADKLEYQENIDEQISRLEDFKLNNKYSISPESVAFYRNYAKYFKPEMFFGLDDDSAIEVNALIYQYIDGAIDADTLIRSMDNKLRMMLLEGV